MNSNEVKRHIVEYLKSNDIEWFGYVKVNAYEDVKCDEWSSDEWSMDELTSLHMTYRDYQRGSDQLFDSEIHFYSSCMVVAVHCSGTVAKQCKESPHKEELLWFINDINSYDLSMSQIMSRQSYGLRLFMRNRSDIILETVIGYDSFTAAPLETEYFMTNDMPFLMHFWSLWILDILSGETTAAVASNWSSEMFNEWMYS